MTDDATLPSADRLTALVGAMAGQPILVLADLVADRFLSGSPKRVSREAPVVILRLEEETFAPGGGANAIANVAALGGRPLPVGVVGDDPSGHELLTALESAGVEISGIQILPGYRTPTKTRVLGGGVHTIKQQIVRFDREDRVELTDELRHDLEAALQRISGQAPVAILSDYGYGTVDPRLLPAAKEVLGAPATIICDSRYRLGQFAGLSGATPNEEEVEALVGHPLEAEPTRLNATGNALRERLAADFLLITRGSLGMVLFDRAGVAHIPIHGSDEVADVTGAGDTVIGTFALAMAAGGSTLEAALLANFAGGLVVMKRGTATVSPAELVGAVRHADRLLEEVRWESS